MALEVLGEGESDCPNRDVEHVAGDGRSGIRKDPDGFRVDQGEGLWSNAVITPQLQLATYRIGRGNRR